MESSYKNKYFKYKIKYLELKKSQSGGYVVIKKVNPSHR